VLLKRQSCCQYDWYAEDKATVQPSSEFPVFLNLDAFKMYLETSEIMRILVFI